MKFIFVISVLIASVTTYAQTLVWSEHVDTSTTFSSPRPVHLNSDHILDIVIGGGLDGSPESRGVVALDGATGSQIWNFATDEEMFGSAQFLDITGDNIQDVFIGGRYAEFYAINGATGAMIWEFFPHPVSEAVDSGWFNFYTPQFIPDQNSDGIEDILVANGGNHALPSFDTLREPGMLLVIDAVTGNVLAKDTMPDGEETYCSAVVADLSGSGELKIIYGSGGEDDGGNLYMVNLTDLMANDISTSVVLATDPDKGFIAPTSLADLNFDGTLDIVNQAYDGTLRAFDGNSLSLLWESIHPGTESSAAPVIGNFIGTITPDVFAVLGKGSAPSFFDHYQVMIDGSTGDVMWKDSIADMHFASANALDMDLNGRDEVVVSLNTHTGSHFIHELLSIDFQSDSVHSIYSPQAGVNIASTPLLCDLDSNGYVDFVYAFRADSVNPMNPNGFKVNRLETSIEIPGVGIAWGSYMGSNFDGQYNLLASNCGTTNPNLFFEQISCNEFDDGYAYINPVGGVAPYTCTWSTGDIVDTIQNLSPGTYNVVVVDSIGCLGNQSFTISDPYVISFSSMPPLVCPDDSTSQVSVSSSGCPCMFSTCMFDWTNGDSTKLATGLWAGWHAVTITHMDGCVTVDSVFVPEPSPVLDSASVSNISCVNYGINDGSIILYLSDSNNTLVSWSTGSGAAYLDSLVDTTYTVELIDTIRGCAELDTFQITAPDSLMVSYTSTDFICFKDSNSSISLSVTGGSAPYTYLWNHGDSLSNLLYIPTGDYQALVTDSMGCAIETPIITINSPTEITNTFVIEQDSLGNCEGSITADPIGGTRPYTISWSILPDTTLEINNLCANTYIITITDSNGCQLMDTAIVNVLVNLNEHDQNNAYIYPNPAAQNVTIVAQSNFLGSAELYDNFGRLILAESLINGRARLDIDHFAAGSYIIVIKLDGKDPVIKQLMIE